MADIDKAIILFRWILGQGPQLKLRTGLDRSEDLVHLERALLARYDVLANKADLDETIEIYDVALKTFLPSLPFFNSELQSMFWSRLAELLDRRFDLTKDIRDLNQAILYRKTLSINPNPAQWSESDTDLVDSLVASLLSRYHVLHEAVDLDEVIGLKELAIAHIIPQEFPWTLCSSQLLALNYMTRFEDRGNLADIDRAIHLLRDLLEPPLPLQTPVVMQLIDCLDQKYDATLDLVYLEESSNIGRQALKTMAEDDCYRGPLTHALFSSMKISYIGTRKISYLNEAIDILRDFLKRSLDPQNESSVYAVNLATTLNTRYEGFSPGYIRDLDEAIELLRTLTPRLKEKLHPDLCDAIFPFLQILYNRIKYETKTPNAYLEEAISLIEESDRLHGGNYAKTHDHADLLRVQGDIYIHKFSTDMGYSHVQKAGVKYAESVSMMPEDDPDYTRMQELAELVSQYVASRASRQLNSLFPE
ncbi:hypothetical protein B0H34DRAFT_679191 [Crassisporium funariophilum]|nr:hypothetical protein B0H34DRAFT_679191 [Crassisporium funariophilum]